MEFNEDIMNEITEAVKDALDEALPEALENALSDILPEAFQDAYATLAQGLKDDATAKDRLHILSQDKTLLAPFTYAEITKTNTKLPIAATRPYAIWARIGIFTNRVIGYYPDEDTAKEALHGLLEALKNAPKDTHSVYEMK